MLGLTNAYRSITSAAEQQSVGIRVAFTHTFEGGHNAEALFPPCQQPAVGCNPTNSRRIEARKRSMMELQLRLYRGRGTGSGMSTNGGRAVAVAMQDSPHLCYLRLRSSQES